MSIFKDLTTLIEKTEVTLARLNDVLSQPSVPEYEWVSDKGEKGVDVLDQVVQNVTTRLLQGGQKNDNGGFLTVVQPLVQQMLQGTDEKSGVLPRLDTLTKSEEENTKNIAGLHLDLTTLKGDLTSVRGAIDSLRFTPSSQSDSADNPGFQVQERLANL